MKKFIFILIFSFFIASGAFASESKGESTSRQHSEHPPHDHHDNDHLKYLRGHGEKRKKKLVSVML